MVKFTLCGFNLVVQLVVFALFSFEFLLYLEFAEGFFDAEVTVYVEDVREVVPKERGGRKFKRRLCSFRRDGGLRN